MQCLYCPDEANSVEHPLPAALGQFRDAPLLLNHICEACNNKLGLLDEQLTRCGPEGLLRSLYGVKGRSTHKEVNIFERGSAGGGRIDLRALDFDLGIEVLIEAENGGNARRMRQLVFVEQSARSHCLLIPRASTPESLRADYARLGTIDPLGEIYLLCDPEERDWLVPLVQQAWPSFSFSEPVRRNRMSDKAVGTLSLTNRYFRAIAKIGFHYFLTQFKHYSGHETAFSEIKRYILDETRGVEAANMFVRQRGFPLVKPPVIPSDECIRAHILVAQLGFDGGCAHLQTFLAPEWNAPIYSIQVASEAFGEQQIVGHAYIYYGSGPECSFAGDAVDLCHPRPSGENALFVPVVSDSSERRPS